MKAKKKVTKEQKEKLKNDLKDSAKSLVDAIQAYKEAEVEKLEEE